MNKTAALRSQDRRAYLQKAAEYQAGRAYAASLYKQAASAPDIARLAGALGLAAGGALGGSAATDDDQSFLKRVGKGTLGTGLAYAGYKTMTDPAWQAGLRTGARTVHDLLASLVARIRGRAPQVA